MSTVSHPHIEISAEGVPHVAGTRTKVVEVVLDRLAHHSDADEIHRQHPHLTLAQIHAALASTTTIIRLKSTAISNNDSRGQRKSGGNLASLRSVRNSNAKVGRSERCSLHGRQRYVRDLGGLAMAWSQYRYSSDDSIHRK